MPRGGFNRHRNKFHKWSKHDFDDVRSIDGSGDHLRTVTVNINRRDHGSGGRKSYPPDMVRRAMAMNLLPTPSGSSAGMHNSGLGPGESWVRITIVYGVAYPLNALQELVNTAFGTQLRFYNVCVEGRNAIMFAKVRLKQLVTYKKALLTLRDPSDNKTIVGDITPVPEPRVPSAPSNLSQGSAGLSNALPEAWMEALRRCFLERFQSVSRSLDLSSLHTDPALLSQGLYLPLNRAAVVHALVSILKDNAAQLSSLNLANNRLTHLNAFSPLGATTDGSPVVSIERIDLSHNPLNGFAVLAGLRGIAGLVELDISETPVSSRFREDDRSVAANLLRVLPNLRRLNGEDLPQTVQFAIEQTDPQISPNIARIPLPESVLGYFPNDDVRIPLLTFLKEYFTRYDSKPRGENLLPYYTTASQLVLSVPPELRVPGALSTPYSSITARLETVSEDGTKTKIILTTARLTSAHYQKSRNLLHRHNDYRRRELVARGSLACASLLGELPATEHPLESLSVDVAFHSVSGFVWMVAIFTLYYHPSSRDQLHAYVSLCYT
ncbi:Nuclear RNA export factor 1 [Paragonimus heterotremus]|uniref:Nuclear RNA export factor 1 n=1 Tax=Paragonimus heterotremus TaxID=100268 RepID=A0A8J4SHT6_9TREM|nr:Nuclear RNA export factor 1 [Paragonimus heterotremus]